MLTGHENSKVDLLWFNKHPHRDSCVDLPQARFGTCSELALLAEPWEEERVVPMDDGAFAWAWSRNAGRMSVYFATSIFDSSIITVIFDLYLKTPGAYLLALKGI